MNKINHDFHYIGEIVNILISLDLLNKSGLGKAFLTFFVVRTLSDIAIFLFFQCSSPVCTLLCIHRSHSRVTVMLFLKSPAVITPQQQMICHFSCILQLILPATHFIRASTNFSVD